MFPGWERDVLERKPTRTAASRSIITTSVTLAADANVPLTDAAAPADAAFYQVRAEWP